MPSLYYSSILSFLLKDEEYNKFENKKASSVSSPEALALLVAKSFIEKQRKMFFLFPTIYEAETFYQTLESFLSEGDCLFFPYDEIFRVSAIGVSPENSDERLLALSTIFEDKATIIVSHASSAILGICEKDFYESNILEFKKNEMYNLNNIVKKLSQIGYTFVDRVEKRGQFAKRGAILDIFDNSKDDPIRIEFFGDEIDDIRVFNARDELSFKKIDSTKIYPATSYLLSQEDFEKGKDNILSQLDQMADESDRLSYDGLKDRMTSLLLDAQNLHLRDVENRFYPLFKKTSSILDYLKDYELYVYDQKEVEETEKEARKKEEDYFAKNRKNLLSLPGERVYTDNRIDFSLFTPVLSSTETSLFVRDNSYESLSYSESGKMLEKYLSDGYSIRIFLPEPTLSNYKNYLDKNNIEYTSFPTISALTLVEGNQKRGFEIPSYKIVFLSSKELYGTTQNRSRFLKRYKESKIIRKYEDLKEGDYVVHEVHGVGRYDGVTTIDGLEYLKITYAENSAFYLPLSQYRMIRKYSSREGFTPTLDKIGGSTWSRKKSKIRSRISFLADQLLSIYAERKRNVGFAFKKEEELEESFIDSFPYTYTESQLKAVEDIKEDMESPYPMDRLIAGDVGFGKTELAFYAAFKAVLSGKQVAFLCPTTILCKQHFKVAKERFEQFGVRICEFSRFISKKEQDENIQKLKEGKIDIAIGTHRLLSDEIEFKDLGLLIIDEEQKFGVAHKEKIKDRRKNIDCLTLTATPIPRTMQMSLLNIRSLSLLEMPPINRMPVKTYVARMDFDLIEETIQKEIDRKGQVYYLHNDIKSIFTLRDKLKKRFPDINIEAVHAQMDKDDIEHIMDDFYSGLIDVLVCTSIIESGLDIPNVNTIIVENADHFGLSQLYQIKGRVGRSDRLAYAYFFFKDSRRLTDEARKRLKALKDFTELGSGYKIAMQDLNIRGAGDILGSEQAGFVDTLGYDAYTELLEEVLKEKEVASTIEKTARRELSFSLDSHIPEDYGSKEQRISMYRELSDCKNDEDLSNFSKKLRDVYGPYPEEVSNLLLKRKIEIELSSNLYSDFVEGLGVYTITASELLSRKTMIMKSLEERLQVMYPTLRIKISGRNFEFILVKTKEYLQDLLFLVTTLRDIYEN